MLKNLVAPRIRKSSKYCLLLDSATKLEEQKGFPVLPYNLVKLLESRGINQYDCSILHVIPHTTNPDFYHNRTKKKTETLPDHTKVGDRWVSNILLQRSLVIRRQIADIHPEVVVAFGNLALFATTENWGIDLWRSSYLSLIPPVYTDEDTIPDQPSDSIVVIPTYSPYVLNAQYELRPIVAHDLGRVVSPIPPEPDYKFQLFPSFPEVMETLAWLQSRVDKEPTPLSVDIETIRKHISCVGIAWSKTEAIVIPIFTHFNYFSLEEELQIVLALRKLLTHPNAQNIGQNYTYDGMMFAWWWYFIPNLHHDTMFGQHVLYLGMQKRLYFQASMYCEYYQYWKDDLKDYRSAPADPEKYFRYNARDCCYTFEIFEVHKKLLKARGLEKQCAFLTDLYRPVMEMMYRGLRLDMKRRAELSQELLEEIAKRHAYYKRMLGHDLNPRSSPAMQTLFYSDFRIKPVMKRVPNAPSRPTTDDAALEEIIKREPLLKPLINRIQEERSIGVILSNQIHNAIDKDCRARTSYSIAGPVTYRFSSSKTIFDTGMNLQNVTAGDEEGVDKNFLLPNIKELFLPEPGFESFDIDLDRADLQVVVWEADDEDFKIILREGLDIHLANAGVIFNIPDLSLDNLRDPVFAKKSKKLYAVMRHIAKQWCHGTNYGGTARTMAINCKISVAESEEAQRLWFRAHPGIHDWHRRVEHSLNTTRTISNAFGFERTFFDRPTNMLSEALAWIPQSTVAIVIDTVLLRFHRQLQGEVILQLQVHDSLAGSRRIYPNAAKARDLNQRMLDLSLVEIPYRDPLVIPTSIKSSPISLGHCR